MAVFSKPEEWEEGLPERNDLQENGKLFPDEDDWGDGWRNTALSDEDIDNDDEAKW